MNNQINSPAGYYQQGSMHPGQPPQQVMVQSQSIPPQNPIATSNMIPGQSNDQFYPDPEIKNDGLIDPIQKSKDMMNQLKNSLQV